MVNMVTMSMDKPQQNERQKNTTILYIQLKSRQNYTAQLRFTHRGVIPQEQGNS